MAIDSILIGTSGYSFPDWVGPFYPPGMKSSDFLRYYAERFPVVEVNSTYYGIPQPRVLEQMEKKTPPGFRFVVKLNQAMTHQGSLAPELYRSFLAVLEPLKAAGKYDALLAQFPWAFKRTPDNEAHLRGMRELLAGEPLFVEFRHRSWITPGLETELSALDLGYCAVDEPQLDGLVPPIVLRTAADGYVRFHGRNAANWWGGDSGSQHVVTKASRKPAIDTRRPLSGDLFSPVVRDVAREPAPTAPRGSRGSRGSRYDYDYTERELREWLTKITQLAEQARRTYLFFNNCHAGQAARNASLMQELLRQQRLQGTP